MALATGHNDDDDNGGGGGGGGGGEEEEEEEEERVPNQDLIKYLVNMILKHYLWVN